MIGLFLFYHHCHDSDVGFTPRNSFDSHPRNDLSGLRIHGCKDPYLAQFGMAAKTVEKSKKRYKDKTGQLTHRKGMQ